MTRLQAQLACRLDQPVVAVIAQIDHVPATALYVAEEHEPMVEGIHLLDCPLAGDRLAELTRLAGSFFVGERWECRVGVDQSDGVIVAAIDDRVCVRLRIVEQVEIVVEIQEVTDGLQGVDRGESERLAARDRALLDRLCVEALARRRGLAVMPLALPGLAVSSLEPRAAVHEVAQLALEGDGELVDGLAHRRARNMAAEHVTVDVQLRLGPCRAREPRIALELERHSYTQHRIAHMLLQHTPALARMILLPLS